MSTMPTCPQCGLTADDPKFGHKIIRLVIVHFDPPTDFPGIGQQHRACDPNKPIQAPDGPGGVPNPWHAGTGDPKVVNCPACMQTESYKAVLATAEDEDAPNSTAAAMGRIENSVTLIPS